MLRKKGCISDHGTEAWGSPYMSDFRTESVLLTIEPLTPSHFCIWNAGELHCISFHCWGCLLSVVWLGSKIISLVLGAEWLHDCPFCGLNHALVMMIMKATFTECHVSKVPCGPRAVGEVSLSRESHTWLWSGQSYWSKCTTILQFTLSPYS